MIRMNPSVWNVDRFKSLLKMKTTVFLFSCLILNKIRILVVPNHLFNHSSTLVLKESVLNVHVPHVVIVFVDSLLYSRNRLESISSS